MPTKKKYISPIQSFDFYLDNFHKLIKKVKTEHDVKELEAEIQLTLQPEILDILQTTHYEALVVTDLKKEILWANNGFKEMTGYSKSFAIGKKPTFLQGANTSKASLLDMRELVAKEEPFTYTLVNYRKNGEEYLCQIQVVPLYAKDNTLTHFLALEKEQKVA